MKICRVFFYCDPIFLRTLSKELLQSPFIFLNSSYRQAKI